MCLRDGLLTGQDALFQHMCFMLGSIFHFEFHQIIESMKAAYAPVDPDSDTRRLPACENIESTEDGDFVALLSNLLEKANYERVTESDLNQALTASSLFNIRLHVDFDDFSEVLLFCRGEATRQESVKSGFGLFSKNIEFTNYERVVVYLRFKDVSDHSESVNNVAKRDVSKGTGLTVLKLFRNVPKADLEMLFPNTRVRMRTIDKLFIGIPAIISGGIVLTTKLGASLVLLGSLVGFWLGFSSQPVELNKTALTALFAGVAALGGYFWKQFNSFKNRKLRFMQTLTQNLYFKNLDNNAGVFHRLCDDAEEEECKEAILAYYLLLSGGVSLSRTELDDKIESWLLSDWGCEVDFDIDDALEKLLQLQLVEQLDGRLSAVPLETAVVSLDRHWDDYFLPISSV
jgi:hypothetical protein